MRPESSSELFVTERVEAAMRLLGHEPGRRERHDARSPELLRIDYRYPEANPPFVLEVTTIDDSDHRAGTSAANKAMRRLSAIAEEEHLGAWLVAVETTHNLRRLEPIILELVRQERIRPRRPLHRFGIYTSDDLFSLPTEEARKEFGQHEKQIRELGIVELRPLPDPARPDVIGVLPMTGMRVIDTFSDWLADAIDDNVEKLAAIADAERHLGVGVMRFDASTFPEQTPVPELPAGIDVLWVVHSWHDDSKGTVWRATPSDERWTIIETARA